MAAPTARSATRTIVVLVDLSLGRRTSTIQSVETSLSSVNRVESSTTWEFGTGYSGRLPRFAYFAKHRERSTKQATSLHESATPTKTPVTDWSIEKGVT
jgi:hypothetical protein